MDRSILLRIFTILALLYSAQCSCQNKPKLPPPYDFPDIYNLTSTQKFQGFELFVEINDINTNDADEKDSSWFTKEWYYFGDETGRLETNFLNVPKTLIYNNAYDEMFELRGLECLSHSLSNVKDMVEFYNGEVDPWVDFKREGGKIVVGTAAILRQGFLDFKDKKTVYVGPSVVRGVNASIWERVCDPEVNVSITYYFSDEGADKYEAIKHSVPLRVEVSGKRLNSNWVNRTYEFVYFKTFLNDRRALLQIPRSRGCRRSEKYLTSDDLVLPPQFNDTDFEMEFEGINNLFEHQYLESRNVLIRNGYIVYDKHYDLLSTEFRKVSLRDKKSDTAKYTNAFRRVFDFKSEIAYEIDIVKGQCVVSEYVVDGDLQPDFVTADVLSPNLKTLFPDNEGYQYIGEGIERGMSVVTFEKVDEDYDFGAEAGDYYTVITRHYLNHASEEFYDNGSYEKESLLKIVMSIFSKTPRKLIKVITFNIHNFRTVDTSKRRGFDVTACFTEPRQSTWISIVFPITPDQFLLLGDDLQSKQRELESLFYNKMIKVLLPTRIGEIIVDISQTDFSVTALLLERPSFILDFYVEEGQKLNPVESLTRSTADFGDVECAKNCISDHACAAFSMCGSVNCLIRLGQFDERQKEASDGCTVFIKRSRQPLDLIPLESELLHLAFQVDSGQFILMVSSQSGKKIPVAAVGFKQGFKMGVYDQLGKKIRVIGLKNYQVSQQMTRFEPSKQKDDKKMMIRANLDYRACQSACDNEEDCHSFSYCYPSSVACVLAPYHKDDLDADVTTKSTTCSIFSKPYTDEYNVIDGNMLVRTCEAKIGPSTFDECARACSTETNFQCLSFDFCVNKQECCMHKVHMLDNKDEEKESVGIVDSNKDDQCSHFSKNFVYEFHPHLEQQLESKARFIHTLEEISLEECARACVDFKDVECLTFDFCHSNNQDKTKCTLSSTKLSEAGMVPYQSCDVYERDPSFVPKVQASKYESSGNRYSGGSGAGFAILLFFVGTAVGVLAIFSYGYFHTNK